MDKIRMRTNAGSIKLRVTTKDGSPCEVWNGGKKIAEMQSDNWENIAVQNKAEEIIIKGYDIQELYCCGSKLTALDISGLTSLKELYCQYNQLTSLAASGLTSLQWLDCSDNQLTELDVNGCTSLRLLDCYDNQLTELDVSGLTSLQYLKCYGNQLTTLNLSGCASLEELECYRNRLTKLNLSSCTSFQWLYCDNNKLTAEAFKKLFEDLPENKGVYCEAVLHTDGDSNYKDFSQPPELVAAFKQAKAKGWRLYKINNDDLMEL
ncbi:leucine-rich repeat domain-containing protein [Treponema phagedenis]|uniref:Leucine-rich repeat domain-containing protein n=1 Tax=Treponema phagedenis TaxID=162 RepID=A0AAE6M886_TREPH|nr:leucine-rich repeat domain-containing protein [Treponema phagedenis]QEJ98099.1 leucine-rich repeat domain-containing protein [Treponema phagedenis]QEK03604.1 leucine-rich repeat domain-containing protein [Treponema phagedenis]